jgi:hypothetical protein
VLSIERAMANPVDDESGHLRIEDGLTLGHDLDRLTEFFAADAYEQDAPTARYTRAQKRVAPLSRLRERGTGVDFSSVAYGSPM